MNLRQIEIFQAVMQTGSTIEAARLLHVSQPGISRMLAHIELQLGLPLFERRKGRLYPTTEAETLYAQVRQVYRGVQRIDDCVRALKEGGGQTLRVLCSPATGLDLVPQAIADVSRALPAARFQVETLPAREIQARLLNREAELAIATVPIEHPLLQTQALGDWTLVCVFPAGHELAQHATVPAHELLRHPLIAFGTGTPQARFIQDQSAALSLPVHSTIEVRSGLMACAIAAKGGGVAVVDELTARAWRFQGLECRPLAHTPRLQIDAISHRQAATVSLATRLLQEVRARLNPPGPATRG